MQRRASRLLTRLQQTHQITFKYIQCTIMFFLFEHNYQQKYSYAVYLNALLYFESCRNFLIFSLTPTSYYSRFISPDSSVQLSLKLILYVLQQQ